MNFLMDMHHYQLAVSLYLLFVNRFKFNLYFLQFPKEIGLDTFEGVCFSFPINKYPNNKVIKLEELKDTRIDFFLPTLQESCLAFQKLRDEYHPKAKIIAQAGNETMFYELCQPDGILTSAYHVLQHVHDVPIIQYYPEIDRDLFKYELPKIEHINKIKCYLTVLKGYIGKQFCRICNKEDTKEENVDLVFQEVRTQLENKNIKLISHGFPSLTYDGLVEYINMNQAINESSATFHYKCSEGWGFSAMNSLICGRPIFTNEWLSGATIDDFLIKERTCFKIPLDKNKITDKMEWYTSDFDRVLEICDKTNRITNSILDYDYEAERVRKFLEKIL